MLITYEEYRFDLKVLAEKILSYRQPRRLFGISKGGLGVAVHLAYLIDNPVVYPIYRMEDDLYFTYLTLDDSDIVVDDFIDSGTTYKNIKANFPKPWFVALYSKYVAAEGATVARTLYNTDYVYLPFQEESI